MFENIKPEDRVRYGTLALLIILVVSTVAIAISGGANVSGGSSQTPVNNGVGAIDTFNGTASANATLLSWDPSLVVVGTGLGLDSLVAELKDSGVVTYDVATADGRILRLARASDVFNLTQELTSLNVSVYDQAVISIPDVHVVGPGIEKTVPGNTFRYTTVPVFDAGDIIPMTFTAEVVSGQLYGLANIRFDAGAPVTVEVMPDQAYLNSSFWRVSIPWENRNLSDIALSAYLPGGSNVNYRARSYVLFNPPLDSAQLQTLSAHMPSYAVSLQPSLMGVRTDMVESANVTRDLAALGLNASFPASPMDIWAYRYPNETESVWKSRSMAVFNQSYPGIVANVTDTYRLNLLLPSAIDDQGISYIVTNRTLNLNSLYPPTDGYTVKLVFTPVGRRAVQFTLAEYSPASSVFAPAPVNPDAGSVNSTDMGNVTILPIPLPDNGTASGPQTGTRAIGYNGTLPMGAG